MNVVKKTDGQGKTGALWILFVAAFIVIIGVGGVLFFKQRQEEKVRAFLENSGVKAEDYHISWNGHYRLANDAAGKTQDIAPFTTMRVGRVEGQASWFGPGVSVDARDIDLVFFGSSGDMQFHYKYHIPQLLVDDGQAVLPAGAERRPLSLADAFVAFKAARVSAPEAQLVYSLSLSGKNIMEATYTYKDMVAEGIENGRINVQKTAGVTGEVKDLADNTPRSAIIKFSSGVSEAHDVNYALLAPLFQDTADLVKRMPEGLDEAGKAQWLRAEGEKARDEAAALKQKGLPPIEPFTGKLFAKDIAITLEGAASASYHMDEVSSDGISLRPLPLPFFLQFADPGLMQKSPEKVFDIYRMIGKIDYTVKGLSMTLGDAQDGNSASFSFGNLHFSYNDGIFDSAVNDMRFGFKDKDVNQTDFTFQLKAFAIKGLRFPNLLDAYEKFVRDSTQNSLNGAVRLEDFDPGIAALPQFDSILMEGAAADIVQNGKAQKLFGLDHFYQTAEFKTNGIPVNLHSELKGLEMQLSEVSPGPADFLALAGYNKIQIDSLLIDYGYDAQKQELAIKDYAVDIDDILTAKGSLTLGGVRDNLFTALRPYEFLTLGSVRFQDFSLNINAEPLLQKYAAFLGSKVGGEEQQGLSAVEKQQYVLAELVDGFLSGLKPLVDQNTFAAVRGSALSKGVVALDVRAKDPKGFPLLGIILGNPSPQFWKENLAITTPGQD